MDENDLLEIAKKNASYGFAKKRDPNKFTQHFPGYVEFERKTYEFWDIKTILELEDIKWWSTKPNFHGYFIGSDTPNHSLMALYDYDIEYYGCFRWYCLGHIVGDNYTKLDYWESKTATHKMSCQILKSELFEKIKSTRPREVIDRMVSDMGLWQPPVRVCDCGYKEKNDKIYGLP